MMPPDNGASNIPLNVADINVILRVLRHERDRLTETRMALETRLSTVGNGEGVAIAREIALVSAEISVLYGVVAKLWNFAWDKARP